MNAPSTIHLPMPDLLGPDLTTLPTLAEQLRALDLVRAEGDVEEYVIAWLAISDENGGGAAAFWDIDAASDAPADLFTGVHLDDQHDERRERRDALRDHHEGIDDFRLTMERELIRRRRFSDNRRTPLIEIKAVVRAFIATGGRLLVPPASEASRLRVEAMPDTRRFVTGDWSYTDQIAARAMTRLCNRWKAQARIERIVRAIGAPTDSGYIVLEGEAP